MAEIKQLPPSVVNKIAAGEVIERPASVVKELLENAVDAGATRIEVAIEKGGLDALRVTDNGHGIANDQLELAVASHATSKISDADDLFCVKTLGFRGEALASIAEVSQMLLRSRTAEQDSGFEIRINGGHRDRLAPCSCAVGTTVEVANLFFNTPVRRKFLKTTQTEMGHVGEAFARIALAQPKVHFSLVHNGRTIHDLPATAQWPDRVSNFFGADMGNSLIPVEGHDGRVNISGFVVDPAHSRGNNRMQYLFLNGRFIRDRALQHALGEAYRGLLMTGRYPIAFLRLDMPAELVDVNVHPAKLEVRFQEGSRLYSQLLGAIRSKFLTTDLTARAQLSRAAEPAMAGADPRHPGNRLPAAADDSVAATPPLGRQAKMDLPIESAFRDWTGGSALHAAPHTAPDTAPQPDARRLGAPESGADDAWATAGAIPEYDRFAADQAGPPPSRAAHPTEPSPTLRTRALQIHNRYLITESDEGVVVIDQHALHERIIYEQLRDKVLSGQLESQRLLVPEPVPLSAPEAAKVIQSREILGQIGIDVEAFGGDTVLVSAYPAMLANHNPAQMLHDVVDLLVGETKQLSARDIIDKLLHMISCKAAIKAGDQLSEDEIDALLEHRKLCQDAHHCPHGRPTALVFSREELDRRFKRI